MGVEGLAHAANKELSITTKMVLVVDGLVYLPCRHLAGLMDV